jgi:hypothetical protein
MRATIVASAISALATAGVCWLTFGPSLSSPRIDSSSAPAPSASVGAVPKRLAGSGKLADGGIQANESSAVATLRTIASAEALFQSCGVVDVDGNGTGEYGFLAEMAGTQNVRGGASPIEPALMSSKSGELDHGQVERWGYRFIVLLPDRNGRAVGEDKTGGDPQNDNGVDARKAEVLWCAYGWPAEYGVTGKRAFFVDHNGDILACSNADGRYSGASRAPNPMAALTPQAVDLSGPIAVDAEGTDGQTWVVVR